MSSKHNGYALITGASAGIGAVYADRLAKQGYDLILVARRGDRLKALAEKITASTGRKVETIVADLTDRAGIESVEKVLRTNEAITLLVNNAGLGAVTPLLNSDVNAMSKMISLNVDAVMRLTYAVVPGFAARGKGTIINISSGVAVVPETLNGVYGATKSFVLAFTQTLQKELSEKGIRVQAVLPGATATDIWEISGMSIDHLPKEIVMQTEPMVDAALAGLELGEVVTIPSLANNNEWQQYEKARLELGQKLSASQPAARYQAAAVK